MPTDHAVARDKRYIEPTEPLHMVSIRHRQGYQIMGRRLRIRCNRKACKFNLQGHFIITD